MKKSLIVIACLLLLGCVLTYIFLVPIGQWKRSSQKNAIEVTLYKNRMQAKWLHSNGVLIFYGYMKGNSFYGHLSSDSSLPSSNQATILDDGSLEVHFLKESNAIFAKN